MIGRAADAESAAGHIARPATLPVEIRTAASMYCDEEIDQAEQGVRQYLLTHGNHIEAMRLLAEIGVRRDILDDAELLLEGVLRLAPDAITRPGYEYAIVLLKRHKHASVGKQMEQLLKNDPDNRVYRTTHASVLAGFGNIEQALPLYRELVREQPNDFELHLSIGHLLKTLGRPQEAIEAYRAATGVRAGSGEVYWSLADMKTYRFTDTELARMRAEEAAPTVRLADRYHLCFALGKALEDREQYADAMVFYERGNALKKTECRYRPEYTERNTHLQAAVCTREFFAARASFGSDSAAPIFIVGLPRSGSTLIEQLLASHSQVVYHGARRHSAAGPGSAGPGARQRQSAVPRHTFGAQRRRLHLAVAEKYLADSRLYRTGKSRFIDKMPNNFHHIGLIHLMLPNAKIIDARRGGNGVLLQQFQAAVRLRAAILIQLRRHRPLLSQLCQAHGPLGRGPAGQGAAYPARELGR